MLPCGKKETKTTWTHQSHQKNKPKTGGRKTTKKKRDWAMGWIGPGLNGDERGDWRSHCPDSFTLWCLRMKLVAMETHHLQAGLPLIHSFIHVTWAVLIRAPGVCCEHVCVGVCSTCEEHQTSSSCFSGLVWLRRQNRMYSTVSTTKSTHCFTCWCPLSCQDVSPSLGDNETKETTLVLPLAAKLRGEALWFGLGLHSQPISFAVSKRMQHVKLFKSNKSLIRSFRCIFHCVKLKKKSVDWCINPKKSDWF